MRKFFLGLLTLLCVLVGGVGVASCFEVGNNGGAANSLISQNNGETTCEMDAQGIVYRQIWSKNEYRVESFTFVGVTDIVIPAIYNGFPVTQIYEHAFENCTDITSVVIPDGVTAIFSSAFCRCSSLTSVVIPDSVTLIGSFAFYGCDNLTNASIPGNISGINEYNLQNVLISSGTVGGFSDCINLKSVTIGDEVTGISREAFKGCSNLTKITIGNGITSIGEDAFSGCKNLTGVYIKDLTAWCNIEFDYGVANPLYYAKNLYLNNELLTELSIPDGVTKINRGAFSECINLVSLTMPDSVTEILPEAFWGCSGLTSVVIPDGVTKVGREAFGGCSGLTSVVIPDSLTWIAPRVFDEGITNATLPILALPCMPESLQTVVLTSGDIIETNAFAKFSDLMSLTLPSSVVKIEEDVFWPCRKLIEVHIKDMTAWWNIEFVDRSSNPLINGAALYLNDELVTDAVFSEGIKKIGYTFSGCSSLTSVTIPDSVREIGEHAFSRCSSLTSIIIPNSVREIGEYAFTGCSSLTSVTLGEGLTTLGEGVFSGCSNLQYTVEKELNYLGNSSNPYLCLISASPTITTVEINANCKVICYSVFDDCENLTYTTYFGTRYLGDVNNPYLYLVSATSSKLTSARIHSDCKMIAKEAFKGCGSLTGVSFVGTTAQWKKIIKGENWNCYIKQVYCTDGDVWV